jgi:hypothetical protein
VLKEEKEFEVKKKKKRKSELENSATVDRV